MNPPLIELAGATFGYGDVAVVSEVDLVVEPGALFGVFGPNGAGKTTLFRGMLGLLQARAGTVRRGTTRIGYVPQRETLDRIYPLTAEEVVRMGAYGRLHGWRGLDKRERELALECLERVDLSAQRRRAFGELSGGQRQRALLARALMAEPELLLLDEPTSGVDRHASERILDLLRNLNGSGLAILLVSHELGLARRFVDQFVWVADGAATRMAASAVAADPDIARFFVGVEP